MSLGRWSIVSFVYLLGQSKLELLAIVRWLPLARQLLLDEWIIHIVLLLRLAEVLRALVPSRLAIRLHARVQRLCSAVDGLLELDLELLVLLLQFLRLLFLCFQVLLQHAYFPEHLLLLLVDLDGQPGLPALDDGGLLYLNALSHCRLLQRNADLHLLAMPLRLLVL